MQTPGNTSKSNPCRSAYQIRDWLFSEFMWLCIRKQDIVRHIWRRRHHFFFFFELSCCFFWGRCAHHGDRPLVLPNVNVSCRPRSPAFFVCLYHCGLFPIIGTILSGAEGPNNPMCRSGMGHRRCPRRRHPYYYYLTFLQHFVGPIRESFFNYFVCLGMSLGIVFAELQGSIS